MELASADSRRNFARFAWVVVAYNLAVILWGAYVRASVSGDGCDVGKGDHINGSTLRDRAHGVDLGCGQRHDGEVL